MNALVQSFQGMNSVRLATIAGIGGLLVMAFIFLAMRMTTPVPARAATPRIAALRAAAQRLSTLVDHTRLAAQFPRRFAVLAEPPPQAEVDLAQRVRESG